MRRVPAILLIALFGILPIGPAFLADAHSIAPSCCRRGGTHHCVSMPAAPEGSGTAASATCPQYPRFGAFPSNSSTATVAAQALAAALEVTRPAPAAHAEPGYRIVFDRSGSNRAPPRLS